MLTMASPNHFSLHSASIAAGAATTATATRPALSSDSAEGAMPEVAVAAAAVNSVGDVAVPANMNAVADADERSTTATSQERVVTVAAKDSTLRMLLSSDPPYCATSNMKSNSSGNSTTTSISRSTAQLVNTSESSSLDREGIHTTGPKANTAMSTFLAPSSAVGAAVIRYTGDQTAPLPLSSAISSHKSSLALFDDDYLGLGDTVLLTCANFTNNELPPSSERRRHQSRPTDDSTGNSREGADGLDKSSKLLRRSTSIRPTIPTTQPVSVKLKTSAPRRSMASSSTAVLDSGELSTSEFTCANCGKSLSSARSLLRHGSTCKGPTKRAGGSGNSRSYIGSAAEKQSRLMSGVERGEREQQNEPQTAINSSGQYAAASDALESGGDSNHDDSNSSALSKIDDVVDSVVEKLRKQNSAPNPQRPTQQRQLEERNLDIKPRRQQDPAMAPLGGASGTSQQQLCQLLVTTADGISHAYRVQGMTGVYYSTLTTTPTTTTTTTTSNAIGRRQYPVETQELQQTVVNDDDCAVTKVKKNSSGGGGPTVYRYLCPECQKPYSCRKNVKRHRVSTHHVPLEIAQTGAIERVRAIVGEEAKAMTGTLHVEKPAQTGEQLQSTPRPNFSSTPKTLRPPPKYVPLPVLNVSKQQPNNRRAFSPPPVHQTMLRPSTGGTYHPMVRAENAKLQQLAYAAQPTGQISTSSGAGNRPGMLSLQQMDCASGDPFSPPLSMPSCSTELMGQSTGSSRLENMLHTPNTAPATMCYSDFDFWDLEGLKSRIEKPLISRSRDDDLEISSIVEDLKRTEYATSPPNATGSNQLQSAFINTISSNGLMEVGGGVSALDYGHSAEMDFTFGGGGGGGSGESRGVLMGSPPLDDSQRQLYAQPDNAYGYYAGDSSHLAYGNGTSNFYEPPALAASGSEAVFRSLAYEEHASSGGTPTLIDNVDHYRIEHGARRVSIGKSDDLIQPTETQHMNGLQGNATSGGGVEKKEKHSLLSSSHNAGTFPCPSCDRLLSTDYSLRRHMKICERLKEKAEAKKKGKRAAGANDARRRRGVRATTEDDDGGLPSSEGSLEVIPPDPDSTSMRFPPSNAGHPSKKTSPTTTHGR